MQLMKLILTNYCQFERLEYDYLLGVTGVTGNNGQGKTNFLDIGQYFSLTGKTPDTCKKEELLMWGKEAGSTEAHFTDAGKRYILTRALQSSKVRLEYLDEQEEDKNGKLVNKVVTGGEVNMLMEAFLGMKPELFYETCFVSQGKLWDVVMMTHTERMRYFQKITGMMKAETIRGILQEEGINKLPLYVDRCTEIAECRKQLVGLRKSRIKHTEAVTQLKELNEGFQEQLPNAQLIMSLPAEEEMAERKERFEITLQTKLNKRDHFLESNEMEDRAPIPRPSKESMKLRDEYDQYVRLTAEWGVSVREFEICSKELKNYRDANDPEVRQKRLKELRREIVDTGAEIRQLTKDIELAEAGKCPNCGHDYEGASVDELRKLEAVLNKQGSAAENELDKLSEAEEEHVRRLSQLTERERSLLTSNRQLADKIKELAYVSTLDVEVHDKQLAKWLVYQEHLQKVAEFQKERDELDKEVTQATLAFEKLKVTKTANAKQKQVAKNLIDNVSELQSDLMTATTLLACANADLESEQRRLHGYEKEMVNNEKLGHLRSLFHQAREMYHRENLPKLVMSHVLVRLNRHLDRFVEFFDLPFVAEINENFDFVLHYPARANVPARRASGGQKVVLSIAYHLAWAEALVGSVPLMTLDEPTNHLDANHKLQVREALSKIQEIANKGTVLMVATHDPALYPAFTRRLDMGALAQTS